MQIKTDYEKNNFNILIVDDDPENLRLLECILTEAGYKVRPAASGSLALRSAKSTSPHLILLDVKMPGVDGYQVCQDLKTNENTRDIPIIFLSGLSETSDKLKAFQAGGVDYITKPFQSEEVLARVAVHLKLQTLQKQIISQNIELQHARDELEQRVTERTAELAQANETLKIALAEKTTLLQELYHRTNNTMQVISALLELQSGYSDDDRVHQMFAETRNRIQAMALVHQKLYQSKDLSRINLQDYIQDLTVFLVKNYQWMTRRIKLFYELEEVMVLIDTAIPCGIILNELISNSLKYAFPEDRSGEIRIFLRRDSAGDIKLKVSDNGVGVPSDFDIKQQKRLGLSNVIALGENQLHGKVDFLMENGFSCQICFKDNLYKARI